MTTSAPRNTFSRGVWAPRYDKSGGTLDVVILRRCKTFTRCRVTTPGEYFGTVQDFHPADVEVR